MTKPLYVFDLDETLIKADSAMIWNEFLVEKGIVDDASFLTEDQRLMALYSQGKLDMDDYLKFAIAPITHLSLGEVEKLVNECVDKWIAPKQFQQSIPLLEQLNKQGVDTLIISATVSFIVEAVARHLGVEQSMGIELVTEDDRYTAQVFGVPSYREGKVTRLEQWLSARDETYSEIHFYTDSINDLPLCEYADYAYLVNPCPRLKAIADRPNWTILHWD
ncbi:HAD family hydrolase [Vibrio coralliilyticus]|uniref:HAD family hydrolase n=1 Tax=Vibrio coralliilyticus TaxID=190893 RepID=UPI00181B4DB5|nr:HAD family hydrolase [Vibrio coralliilyticus]NUW69417.1 HAD family hydrolase [Vibrio coralliilyticus]